VRFVRKILCLRHGTFPFQCVGESPAGDQRIDAT
jgi:hypothetical protein